MTFPMLAKLTAPTTSTQRTLQHSQSVWSLSLPNLVLQNLPESMAVVKKTANQSLKTSVLANMNEIVWPSSNNHVAPQSNQSIMQNDVLLLMLDQSDRANYIATKMFGSFYCVVWRQI